MEPAVPRTVGDVAIVRPVPRRIHSAICRAARCTAGSGDEMIAVAALIVKPSPVPGSTNAGIGVSAGIARAVAAGWGAGGCGAGGWGTGGCEGGGDGGIYGAGGSGFGCCEHAVTSASATAAAAAALI